uniref:Uncharacterized protein n=1 Tax=Anguilla anguilla TaxID=7936 RepID=A0A0E9UPX0_ANGAN
MSSTPKYPPYYFLDGSAEVL